MVHTWNLWDIYETCGAYMECVGLHGTCGAYMKLVGIHGTCGAYIKLVGIHGTCGHTWNLWGIHETCGAYMECVGIHGTCGLTWNLWGIHGTYGAYIDVVGIHGHLLDLEVHQLDLDEYDMQKCLHMEPLVPRCSDIITGVVLILRGLLRFGHAPERTAQM